MTPEFLAQGACAAVLRALPGARAVGGAVRDFLAGRAIHDVDVAVPLPPDEVSRLLRSAGLKVFETGLKHGTVTAVLNREPVEVTSLRRDVATDGRHAEVEWIADWREDAARRDFTINAMSMGLDGAVHDFFGGRDDLAAGRVRFVGDARARLAEDYLRALRFFRFWARYGRGAPDETAVAAIRDAVPGLAKLSVERVWMEIKRLLEAPDPTKALILMEETGVLGATLPHGMDTTAIATLNDIGAPADILLRFAAISRAIHPLNILIPTTEKPYPMSAAELALLTYLHEARQPHPTQEDARVWLPSMDEDSLRTERARFALGYPETPAKQVPMLRTWLAQAFPEDMGYPVFPPDSWAELRRRISATRAPEFPLQGSDVVALGLPPGILVGRTLQEARVWWLSQKARPGRLEALEKLRQLVSQRLGC